MDIVLPVDGFGTLSISIEGAKGDPLKLFWFSRSNIAGEVTFHTIFKYSVLNMKTILLSNYTNLF